MQRHRRAARVLRQPASFAAACHPPPHCRLAPLARLFPNGAASAQLASVGPNAANLHAAFRCGSQQQASVLHRPKAQPLAPATPLMQELPRRQALKRGTMAGRVYLNMAYVAPRTALWTLLFLAGLIDGIRHRGVRSRG